MTPEQFDVFEKFRNELKNKITEWQKKAPNTHIIYNTALNDITIESEIKLLIIGDNPGKSEKQERKYFVGHAGKLGEKFFLQNYNELKICFRENVIILNKTPIHSAKTTDLKKVEPQDLIKKSQEWMAKKNIRTCKRTQYRNMDYWL